MSAGISKETPNRRQTRQFVGLGLPFVPRSEVLSLGAMAAARCFALLRACFAYQLGDWNEFLPENTIWPPPERLGCFQSSAFHPIVVAVQHLPVCIHKFHLAVAGRKLVP
jgi:hypothetical protein